MTDVVITAKEIRGILKAALCSVKLKCQSECEKF